MIITEDFIQQEIVMWFTNNYCLKRHNPRAVIFSVPNGGKRDGREAKKLKNTGLLKGASDLIIDTGDKTVYCEVKTFTGSQSPEQKEFQAWVESLGRDYIMPRSLEEFKKLIKRIIEPDSHA